MHTFHTQTLRGRAESAAMTPFGWPPFVDEEMFVGAACGPAEFWDETKQACVPLSFPQTPIGPAPQCPPGQFYDYLRQACTPSAAPHAAGAEYVEPLQSFVDPCPPCFVTDPSTLPAYLSCRQYCDPKHPERAWSPPPSPPHATSGLGDVTVGPHLITPLGWPYAWGQALGLWGGQDKPSAPPPSDPYYRGERSRGGGNTDWATVALVGISVAGVLGLGYLVVKGMTERPRRRAYED